MKSSLLRKLLLVVLTAGVLYSCADKCSDTYKVTETITVYKALVDVRNTYEVQAPKEITRPGKLYVFGDVLFVVDLYSGFHIINNSNPSAPVRMKFIELDGCTDLVVNNDYIYANSANDLVTIHINNGAYDLVKRNLNEFNLFERKEDSIAIDYIVTERWVTSEEYNCESGGFIFGMQDDIAISSNGESTGSRSGTGGSTARMTVVNDYIYAVDNQHLLSIDIRTGNAPTKAVRQDISQWMNSTIETIFPMGDYLFIGTTTGMQIFNHSINPVKPVHESTAEHFRSCDPVVVQNDIAYVTTRGGNRCGGARNSLYTYDVSDVKNPVELAEYPMNFPHGLGIDGSTLFICEEDFGLKVYNASDPKAITDNLLTELTNISPVDLIPLDGLLIVTAKDGVYQYDYSNPSKLILLSKVYDIKSL